jgi:hypothetical protein
MNRHLKGGDWAVLVAGIILSVSAGGAFAAIADGLVGYWPLNEGSGTSTEDASPNSNNGTISGATWTTAGKFGNALSFNGTSNYVSCGSDASLRPSSALSISAWVKPASFGYYEGIVCNFHDTGSTESGYCLVDLADGVFCAGVAGSDGSIGYVKAGTYSTGQWHHVALVFDGAMTRLFVNGSVVKTTAESAPIDYNPLPLYGFQIGRYADDNEAWYYDGVIDDVGVWSRALSAGEISWLYNGGAGNSILGGACVDVNETGGSTEVQEGGAGDSYTVVLCTQPAYSVVITATPSDGQITLNGAAPGAAVNLTFTTGNWNTPQTVNVAAFDDDVYEGTTPHITTITHSSQSSDPKYNNISIRSVDVSVIDNEQICGDWGYLKADLNKDCYVDLRDFAEFAAQWLQST